jgi:NADPH:quinone reductase-like Zn-dependent oxidoreductase
MGVVSKVGPGVTSFKEGQRVTSLGWLTTSQGSGSWQQYITLPAEKLVALPDEVSDEAGAQFYVSCALCNNAGMRGCCFLRVGVGRPRAGALHASAPRASVMCKD